MSTFKPATFTDGYRAIVDSSGATVSFQDPRVVHIWPIPFGYYLTNLLKSIYERRGLRIRTYDTMDHTTLQQARDICSGRECMPVNAIAGLTYHDLVHARQDGELSLYYWPDQLGPCQNGAWPIVIDNYVERAKVEDAIFSVWLTSRTNFFGQGQRFGMEYVEALVLANLLDEMESSLKAVARDKEEALDKLEHGVERIFAAARQGRSELATAIRMLVLEMAKIPRRARLEDVPKVLLFGGLNLLFINEPIRAFLEDQGLAVKWLGMVEGMTWVASEPMVRHGLRTGKMSVKEQFNTGQHLRTLMTDRVARMLGRRRELDKLQRSELRAANSWLGVRTFDAAETRLRKKLQPSGLLFDRATPFSKIAAAGEEVISNNTFTETSITVGRYLCSEREGVFDGLLAVGSFNCQPAQNSIAAIRAIAEEGTVPFASIDCDGTELSSNQIRVLENLAVQARRHQQSKPKSFLSGLSLPPSNGEARGLLPGRILEATAPLLRRVGDWSRARSNESSRKADRS